MSEETYLLNVVGYVRVSTSEQADSGAGLEAQRASITAEAARRGWQLLHVFEDAGASRPRWAPAGAGGDRGSARGGIGCCEARSPLALAPRLRGAHGARTQARLESHRPRPRSRYLDALGGDDGVERLREVSGGALALTSLPRRREVRSQPSSGTRMLPRSRLCPRSKPQSEPQSRTLRTAFAYPPIQLTPTVVLPGASRSELPLRGNLRSGTAIPT